ncbi:MAG: hypothetical protein WC436_02565 [Candidatus Babeliales bacterium]
MLLKDVKKFLKKFIFKRKDYFQIKLLNFIKFNSVKISNNKPIIFWELGGFPEIFRRNAIFSIALKLRGYDTHFIICDEIDQACIQREVNKQNSWENYCKNCINSMKLIAKRYDVNYSQASEFIDINKMQKFRNVIEHLNVEQIERYKFLDINVGELALSSFIRYKQGYPVLLSEFTKDDEYVYRKYLYSAIINTYIADVIIKKYNPISILTSHGMYVDYAPSMFVGFKNKINAFCWSSGFSEMTHYFSIPESEFNLFPRRITEFEWEKRKKDLLTQKEDELLNKFFIDRYVDKKTLDTASFEICQDTDSLKKRIGINNDNPIVCFFSHLNWDACTDFDYMIFKNPYDWIIESINKIKDIKNVNWLIKIHPIETINNYGTLDEIRKRIKDIPENIIIINSDIKINSYSLYNLINCGITIFGTVGVELPCLGKHIITLGKSHFSDKGFSLDMKSKEQYFDCLENIKNIKPLTQEQIKLARQYAYSYFIQRQIPLNIINKKQGHWGDIDIDRLDELLPGKDPVLDKLCESIISGKDVILDENCLEYLEKIKKKEI